MVASLRDRVPPGVELVLTDGEPTRLIEAWTGAALAVVIDAVRADPSHPGRAQDRAHSRLTGNYASVVPVPGDQSCTQGKNGRLPM